MYKMIILFFSLIALPLFGKVINREGNGVLETIEGQTLLHVKGTPYERGFQHGKLLKNQIQHNIDKFIKKERPELNDRTAAFAAQLPEMLKHIPESIYQELQGLSEGSGIPLKMLLQLNLFPELFHCSALSVSGGASLEGKLYHVRVLDYSVGKNLQDTAVLIVSEPDDGYAFLNVSYAGFIGCITGMNDHKIALGEVGGSGYGYWNGVPMAFLMRQVLEKAATLEEAKEIFAAAPRTCQYYYLISDGNTDRAVGVYATPSQIQFIEPGTSYALLSPSGLPAHYEKNGDSDKFYLSSPILQQSEYQTAVYEQNKRIAALFHQQPKDCVAIIGYSNPERYPILMDRLMASYGKIGLAELQEIIKLPVAGSSNLHNAIFLPSELKVWIAHRGPNEEPACNQPYYYFYLSDLLK